MKKIFIQEEFDWMSNGSGEHYAKIKVIGVGGGGMNAVNRMIASGLGGVDFIAMNTDVHVLELSNAKNKLQLGSNLTRGLGAGGAPSVGRESAEESKPEIRRMLEGADMIFIAAGLGGGTGTGAAPVIAEMSREAGILTVAVVTKPFTFEGPRRAAAAEQGVNELKECVDTLIVIPNDRLLNVVEKKATLNEAFSVADDVLRQGVQGISDIITIPGLINVDFADVKAIMQNQGTALMGIGISDGENRAAQAAEIACASPLLETTIDGACGILLNVTGGPDLTLNEVYEAAEIVYKACDIDSVNVIFGAVIDPEMANKVKITVVATGFDGEERKAFMRAKASAAVGEQDSNSSEGFDAKAAAESLLPDDELEIPTFLRRGR